jgi:glycosyltransferase involved in cell wall biosynthesis
MSAANHNVVPRVSIIIPAYNAAPYLSQALDSLLAAADSHTYQIIVVDDGSTDETAVIAKTYGEQITYHYQPNRGSAAARNAGLALARAAYVLFLDADDYRLSGYLTQQCCLLDEQPAWGAVHSGWRVVDAVGMSLDEVRPWTDCPTLDLAAWLVWKPVFLGAILFRREWLMQVGGLDASLRQAHDVDLLWRLALAGCQVGWLRQITVCYRQHETNTTKNGRVQVQSLDQLLHTFFQRHDLPVEVRSQERTIRYFTHLWQAWYLLHTGNWDWLPDYLVQARIYAEEPDSLQTCFTWVTHFACWSRTRAYPAQSLPDELWSQVWAALDLPLSLWPDLQSMRIWWSARIIVQPDHPYLDLYRLWLFWQTAVTHPDMVPQTAAAWWCDNWYHYACQEWAAARQGVVDYPQLNPDQWQIVVQAALIATPDLVGPASIAHLWQDLVEQGCLPAGRRQDVRLYLSGMAQAVLNRRWHIAKAYLLVALRRSAHPWAVFHWLAFARAGLRYALAR